MSHAARGTVTPMLIFKHSTCCGRSYLAQEQVAAFAAAHPECAVVTVDVLAERAESRRLAEKFGVTHESPQVLLVVAETVFWHASHGRVDSAAIAAAYARAIMAVGSGQ